MILGQIPFVKPGHFTENSSASFMFSCQFIVADEDFFNGLLGYHCGN